MSLLPSARLVWLTAVAAALSPMLLVVPEATLALLGLDLMLAAAAAIDWYLSPRASLLDVSRLAPDRMSVLGAHAVSLVVRNGSHAALSVRLSDTPPAEFRTEGAEGLAGIVAAEGEERFAYTITPMARGRFGWGPIHLAFRSLLGFWERRKVVPAAEFTRVYPNLAALQRYHLLASSNRLEVLGIRKARLRVGAWEFESLRDYVQGDDVRMIDWKATARRSKPIFRNHEAERNQTILILVDSGRLMNAEVDGVSKLDHAVNTALVLAHVALSRRDRVGLCSFSSRVHSWVAPRAHVAQIRLITDALYDLRGDLTETDHGRCLRLLASRHPKRALLVVLTDFVDSQTASEMVAHLHLAARRHLVLFAALKDPFLSRAARARPARAIDAYRKAAAIELLRDRREVLERIHQMGAHVLDAEPAGITPPLLNRYLQIAFRGQL